MRVRGPQPEEAPTGRAKCAPDDKLRAVWKDGATDRNFLKLQVRKGPHADAWQQHLVLGVGDRIADILIQQIVADDTDDHLARAEPGRIELGLVADLCLQQIVSWRRRLADRRDVVLRKRMQQVDACEPVGLAPIDAAADPYRRNPRHVGAVGEGGADDIELILDAPDAAMERPDIELTLEF